MYDSDGEPVPDLCKGTKTNAQGGASKDIKDLMMIWRHFAGPASHEDSAPGHGCPDNLGRGRCPRAPVLLGAPRAQDGTVDLAVPRDP